MDAFFEDAKHLFSCIYFSHQQSKIIKNITKKSYDSLWYKCFPEGFEDSIRGFEPQTNILFFLYIVLENKSFDVSNKKKILQGKEFNSFKQQNIVLPNFNKDKIIISNVKSFQELQKLWYKKTISDISFYICLRCLYQDCIEELLKSSIYKLMWFKVNLIGTFIKYKPEEQNQIKEWCHDQKENR